MPGAAQTHFASPFSGHAHRCRDGASAPEQQRRLRTQARRKKREQKRIFSPAFKGMALQVETFFLMALQLGGDHQRMADAIRVNNGSLESLDISSKRFSAEGAKVVAEALKVCDCFASWR
jgi:hypothetical protein